jgi:hypothetical protein
MATSQSTDNTANPVADHSSRARQTPSPGARHIQFNSQNSPPYPDKKRRDSLARKRTNEEAYEPVVAPQKSPRNSQLPARSLSMATVQEAEAQKDRVNPFSPQKKNDQVKPTLSNAESVADRAPLTGTFVSQIEDYQRELEEDFQQFERQLNERDLSAQLDEMSCTDIEANYNKDIEQLLQQENAIMQEFGDRFNVSIVPSHRHRA